MILAASNPVISVSGAVLPALATLIAGLSLWAFGNRLLRPWLVVSGLLVGAAMGWTAGLIIDSTVPAWALALVGALAGAAIGFVAARVLVILVLCLAMAGAGGYGAWWSIDSGLVKVTASETAPTTQEAAAQDDLEAALIEFLKGLRLKRNADSQNAAANNALLASSARAQQLRERYENLRAQTAQRWNALEPVARRTVLAGAAIGGMIGLLIGVFSRTLAAIVVTSVGGAAMMLAATAPLGLAIGGEGSSLAGIDLWTMNGGVWLITMLLGAVIQWMTRPRMTDTRPDPAST